MSTANGKYVPSPTRRLRGTLFGVLPPGHPEELEPATEEYCAWYEEVVEHITGMVLFIVGNVRRNYTGYRGVKFDRRTVRKMYWYAATISRLFGGQWTDRAVAGRVKALVKQCGLVISDPAPGPRHNWPMPATAFLDKRDAERIVRDALWGHYPDPVKDAPTGTQPGHAAAPAQVTRSDD